MEVINIKTKPSYQVLVGHGLLNQAHKYLKDFISNRQLVIITDSNVKKHGYSDTLINSLKAYTSQVHEIVLLPGENSKSMEKFQYLLENLSKLEITRSDYLIALGGGVVGDLVGFTAATYLRGISYIQIPTTFLSAIDSSVGGKTAINLSSGKNLVGAFWQPRLVLCDLDSFRTLPRDVFEDGCSEMIKYGMIMSPWLLDILKNLKTPLNPKSSELEKITAHCISLKRDIVEADEKELNQRQLLNFGHTIGHAIEKTSNYQLSHGRSVAWGMLIIMKIAENKGLINNQERVWLEGLLAEYNLLNDKLSMDLSEISEAILTDKKRQADMINLVIPTGQYGKCQLKKVSIKELNKSLEKVW